MTARPKARNGEGSIRPRTLSDGKTVYDVAVSYIHPVTGKRERVFKRGLKSEADAVRYRNSVAAQADQGTYTAPSRDTVEGFLTSWLENKRGLKEQTKAGYAKKIRLHVIPHIGGIKLANLKAYDLDDLYRHLETKGSPGGHGALSKRSVREIHTILSGAFREGVRKGALQANPCALAEPPTPKEAKAPEFTVWNPEDVRRFLSAERSKGSPYAALWEFLVSTGVRRGEALGLRWSDVDLDAGTATIRNTVGAIAGRVVHSTETKTGKARF